LGQARLEDIRQEGEDPEREATDFTMLPQFEYLKVGSSAERVNPLDAPA